MKVQDEKPKTQGEMEAAVCEKISQFQLGFMGRGPKEVHAHLMKDLLVIRMAGVLSSAEQQLAGSPEFHGILHNIREVRRHLLDRSRPVIDNLIREATGVHVTSLLHDLSDVSGEEFMILTLERPPHFRNLRSLG